MADSQPSMQELVNQIVQLGTQVQALQQRLTAATIEINNLKSNSGGGSNQNKTAWCGLIDRKQMAPKEFCVKSEWRDWSEQFMYYFEENQAEMASHLVRAQYEQEPIVPTYPSPENKKLAVATFHVLKMLIKETEGKRLVRSMSDSKNPFEL